MHLYVAPNGVVLGSQRRAYSRIHIAPDIETAHVWHAGMLEGKLPKDVGKAISGDGMRTIFEELERVEDEDGKLSHYRLGKLGRRFIKCATSFREFLRVWTFESNYRKQVMRLGDDLWPGQELAVATMERYPRAYFLKARRLGETTLAVAFDAWILLFTPSCRVHLVSRIEKDAKDSLLKPLKFGLSRLPEEMKLAVGADTTTMLELIGGPNDRRVVEAFAAKEPGRGYGATHVHLDEWAAMMETSPDLPEDVWKAIAPTLNPDSSFHVLTTGKGPGFYAEKWEEAIKGSGEPDEEGIPTLYACFIRATGSRPDYTPERVKRERAESGTWEYPERWEEAIAGQEGNYFTSYEIDWAHKYARGFLPGPIYVRDPLTHNVLREASWGSYVDTRGTSRRRKFVKAWDIGGPGEKSDASCGILLDVTEEVWDVRGMVYLRGQNFPALAAHIDNFHRAYPGPTIIEDNWAGLAVRQFLTVPPDQVRGWKTTLVSKGPALRGLKIALGLRLIKWNPEECPELDAEMRRYQLKDENIKQDTVMALAIAVAEGPSESAVVGGKVIRLFGDNLTL